MSVRKITIILSIVSLFLGLPVNVPAKCAALASPTSAVVASPEKLDFAREAPHFAPTFAPNLTFIGVRSAVLAQFSSLNDLTMLFSSEYGFMLIDLMLFLFSGLYLCSQFSALAQRRNAGSHLKAKKSSLQS